MGNTPNMLVFYKVAIIQKKSDTGPTLRKKYSFFFPIVKYEFLSINHELLL